MAALTSLWTSLNPYGKVLVAAISAGLVAAFGPSVAFNLAAGVMGKAPTWPTMGEAWSLGWRVSVVAAVTYWAHSPKGREVWTDDQRQAAREALEKGKL